MIQSERNIIRVAFVEPVLGTSPTDRGVYSTYVAGKETEALKKSIKKNGSPSEADIEDELDTLPEPGPTTGFHKDATGLYLYNYQIKGFAKNAGNILKDQLKVKNLRGKLTDFLFVNPRKIYFKPYRLQADTIIERPLIADTPRGKRVALAASEAINPPASITFELELLRHKEIQWEHIWDLMEYGSRMGIGQWRNSGHGQFTYGIVKPGEGEAL